MNSSTHSGLVSNGQQIPLQGVRIDAKVSGLSSQVTVTQRYHNQTSNDLEAVYVFPLEEAAAVSGFRARVGDKTIVGRVEEREKAFESYDDAMAGGHGAFLLEQERPNVFTASVGNLKAGSTVEVCITYVALLNNEGPAVRFALPTTVAPRYVPAGPPEVGQPDGDRVNPEAWHDVPYGLTLSVEVSGEAGISSIESPSHTVRTEMREDDVRVTLATREDTLDRDFVLLISPREAHKPTARVAREADGTRVAMVSFIPDADKLPVGGGAEIQFVLDCSGSMQGTSIDEARRALELCVRAMSEGDTFNIIRFGSSYQSLWDAPQPYDQEHLDEAVGYIRRSGADLGGTEILTPLQYVLGMPANPERPRQVLLLTDGEVSNEAAVIALCREKAATARVFAFGIGHGASEHLVRGVARASRGAAEFIYPGERVEAKVLRMFGRVRTPALTNAALSWGDLRVDQAPKTLPPVFAGDPLTVFARISGGAGDEVTLTAADGSWSIPIDLETAEAGGPIPTLWARQRIRELEAGRGGPRGSNQSRAGRREDRQVDEIVDLAIRYSLMSQHTSFVAVEERADADRTDEQAQLVRIPVALTKGWGGHRRPGVLGGPSKTMAGRTMAVNPNQLPSPSPAGGIRYFAPPAAQSPVPRAMRKGRGGVRDAVGGLFRKKASPASDTGAFPPAATAASPGVPDRLYDLLLKQQADGSFRLSPALAAWLGDRAAGVSAAAKLHGEALVATAVAVALLEAEMADRKAEWKMAADKAKRWLAKRADSFDPSSLL